MIFKDNVGIVIEEKNIQLRKYKKSKIKYDLVLKNGILS